MKLTDQNFYREVDGVLEVMRGYEEEYPMAVDALEQCLLMVDGDFDCEADYGHMILLADNLAGADPTEQLHPAVAELTEAILLEGLEKDDAEAINTLGALYYDGRIGIQSYEKAAEYYEKAAALGNEYAQENLGYIWYYGRTGKTDYEKAFHCFVKGALAGRPVSMYKVGDMYRNGYFVEKDPVAAFKIYNQCQAFMNDDTNIMEAGADISMRIADCLFDGIGTDTDYAGALMFYQQAERLYYDRIKSGDHMYQSSLKHVLINEQICRQKMLADLPDFDWVKSTGK